MPPSHTTGQSGAKTGQGKGEARWERGNHQTCGGGVARPGEQAAAARPGEAWRMDAGPVEVACRRTADGREAGWARWSSSGEGLRFFIKQFSSFYV